MNKSRKRKPFSERRSKHKALGEHAPKFNFAMGPQFSKQQQLALVFPFRRSKIGIVVSGLFLVAFSYPLIGVLGDVIGDRDDSLFSLVATLFAFFWGLGWSVGVFILAAVFLALSFGRETLEIRNSELDLRVGMPLLGIGARCPADYIRNFRRQAPDVVMGTSWRGEHLAFDFAGDEVGFGSAVDPEQAKEIITRLCELFPQQGKPPLPLPKIPEQEHIEELKPEAIEQLPSAEPLHWRSVSSLALIGANLIPLLGVFLLDWNVGEIMLLFWAESAVIGFYNLLKMIKIGGWATLMYGPFFVGHYGGFMAGHLLFIYGLFGDNFANSSDPGIAQLLSDFVSLSPALLAFVVSHGISYYSNFLGRKEYLGREIAAQMGQPYKRIIIMHMTIIFGGFLVMMFESALPALLLLLLLKIATDLGSHLREHRSKPVSPA